MSENQMRPTETAEAWAAKVAALAVDVLVDAGLVSRAKLEAATAIVADEINVRLCLEGYPPPTPFNSRDEMAAQMDDQSEVSPNGN